MKKFYVALCIFSTLGLYSQSLVTDLNFQNFLSTNFPDAVFVVNDEFFIDGNHESVLQTEFLYFGIQNIENINGIEAFTNLKEFDCSYNQITTIQNLPEGLEYLVCNDNQITNIAHIPSTVWLLNCTNNLLEQLPPLPDGMELLNCSNNQLTSLPSLPLMLSALYCEKNNLTQLPQLSPALLELNCSENQLSTLPQIPSSVYFLNCTYNQITHLPSLSNFYGYFYCDFNQISTLPSLSNNIFELGCSNNQLTTLPSLPNNLQYLGCAWNQLTQLPTLPQGLTGLWAVYNNIACFPPFPASLVQPNSVLLAGNPHTCLPNYVSGLMSQDFSYPLCEDNDPEHNPFGCQSTASVEQLESRKQLGIYPNPFQNALRIEATSIINHIKVFSISGKQVFTLNDLSENNNIELHLEGLDSGIYLIDISTDNTVLRIKITKM